MKIKEKLFLVDFLVDQLKKNNEKKNYKPIITTKLESTGLAPFILYNNIKSLSELYASNQSFKENKIKNYLNLDKKPNTLTTEYRKVYQSLYLKQIPLQLTQLYITTTPQFKDNLTFSSFNSSIKVGSAGKLALNSGIESSTASNNLFYTLFLKNYATSNGLNQQKTKKKSKGTGSSSSDHITYNLNTLDSIKSSNPNFTNIGLGLGLFLKKKRQILLTNKNISNKKIKKLYYNWYKIQLTRRYLNNVNQPLSPIITKTTKKNKKNIFFSFLKKEQQKIKKLKLLKKIL